jgi:hypothetical protein
MVGTTVEVRKQVSGTNGQATGLRNTGDTGISETGKEGNVGVVEDRQ